MQDFSEFFRNLFTATFLNTFLVLSWKCFQNFSKFFQHFITFPRDLSTVRSFSKATLTFPHNFSVTTHIFSAVSQKLLRNFQKNLWSFHQNIFEIVRRVPNICSIILGTYFLNFLKNYKYFIIYLKGSFM